MLPLGPRALGVSGQLGHKVGRADNIVVAEDGPDIPQQFHANGAILLLARKQASSPARLLRPSPAREVSDRQERAPVVGRAVVQVGDLRIWIGQLVEVIGRPPGSEPEIKGAITRGERKDGTKLKPPMGFALYATMTDGDLNDLIAYLRTVPAKE
jgi:hypothetical protein